MRNQTNTPVSPGLRVYLEMQKETPAPINSRSVTGQLKRAIAFRTQTDRLRRIMKVPDISKPLRYFIDQKNLRDQAAKLGREIATLDPNNLRNFIEYIDPSDPINPPKYGALLTEVQTVLTLIAEGMEEGPGSGASELLEKLGDILQSTEAEEE